MKQALSDADVCVKLRPEWEKGYFRRGCALEANDDDDGAMEAFELSLKHTPGGSNPEIAKKLKHLKKKSKPFVFPKAKNLATPDAPADPKAKAGPTGDARWLLTAKSPSEPVSARVDAVNAVGAWLSAHLEKILKRPAGDVAWFFEDQKVEAFLDAGVFDTMLDVLTHTVCAIIAAESGGGEDAKAAAAAGADLAGAAAGVLHNLLHPALRAWNTRAQHQTLLSTLCQVLRMVGSPLNDPKGTKISANAETKQFTMLVAKILGNAGALGALCGQNMLFRERLQMMRAIVQRERKDGKEEELATKMIESARAFVILRRCRFGKSSDAAAEDGARTPAPAWEPVLDRLLTDEGADEIRDEIAAVVDQHSLLAGAFKKFGFEGSVGV